MSIIKILILSNLIYKFNVILIKIPAGLFIDFEEFKNLYERTNIQDAPRQY